jgi:CMP-N-acetylneuraminic acid synthetase
MIKEKPLCIIPARGGSKRIPKKNISILAGKPLLAYAIESAIESNIFDKICVSSDDDEILDIARYYGANLALKRPSFLSSDNVQIKDVCVYLLEYFLDQGIKYKDFGVLLVTNPLRTAKDIKEAYRLFKTKDANYVMSLVPFSHPPQRAVSIRSGFVEPFFGIEYMKQTQLLEILYRHDGSIIFAKSDTFLKTREFYGEGVIPYLMPAERSVDIDTPIDLAWAEFLISQKLCKLKCGEEKK